MADFPLEPLGCQGKAVLFARPLAVDTVEVPEWGVTVRVQALSVAEKVAYEAGLVHWVDGEPKLDPEGGVYQLFVRSVVDAQGARIFDDADISAIQALDGTGFARILEVAKRLSLSDPEVIAARKKRFASVRPSTSSAGSPSG